MSNMTAFKSLQEMIQDAVDNKRQQIKLTLRIGDQDVALVMRGVDEYNFDRKRVLLEQQLRADAARAGLVGADLSEEEWKRYLASLDQVTKRLFEKNKRPLDRAELYVARFMGYGLLFTMVPDCLYLEDGTKFLQSDKDFADFEELMRRDPLIVSILSAAYVSLVERINGLADEAKNSSAPTNEVSGSSGANLQGDIPDTEPPSQKG